MKKHLSKPKKLLNAKIISLGLKVSVLLTLTLTMSFSAFAAGELLLSERVQLTVDNVTLKDALREIERQSEFTFLYNDASIDVNQAVTLSTTDLTVKELLDEVLENKGINYTIVDNQIVLTQASAELQEQKTITGTILDAETGDGLPGVTVLEKGTSNGTITDLDGNFTLNVAENATVVVSYVGYVTEEISVAGMNEVNVNLVPDIINLDDVVVIGYGTVKKSDLTGAVASVSAEELNQTAVSGLDQALQGRTAGVTVTTSSGTPGAAPMVMIRGMGTITNPNPLFIVDGLPVSADEVGALNPGDIESTEILKDASAAAIYGSRAGNGVVMITTKKGKTGKTSVNYDAYEGIQMVAKKIDLTNAEEFVTLRNAAGNDWEDSSTVETTDWQDEIFRQAAIRNHQLSFLGGTEKINYALLGSYYKQEGIIKGSDYERYTIRANTSAKIKPWITVGENASYSISTQNTIPEQDEWTSVVITALNMDPATPVYISDSARANEPNEYNHYAAAERNNIFNPVGTIARNHNVTKTHKLLGNIFLDLEPIKGLKLRTSYGAEITNWENEQFFPEYFESVAHVQDVNALFRGKFNNRHLVWENTATYNRTFAEKHDLTVMGGYTRELTTYRYFAFNVSDVPTDPDLWFAVNSATDVGDNYYQDITDNAVGNVSINEPRPYDAALISYLGRFIYSYDRLFDLTGSIRRDGSSRFTGDDKWALFPSFAAGLKISELPFFQNVGVINFLKLRVGWGRLGNQEIGDYAAYTSVDGNLNYTFGVFPDQATYPGGAPRRIGNTNLFWEETDMTNIGLDVNLLENRLALNIDAYKRRTVDMLAAIPLPMIVGVQEAPWANSGEVVNTGLEINAIYKNKIGDFSYNISGNIGFMKNEVVDIPQSIPGGPYRDAGYVNLTEEGHPIASFYGYVTDGYWQSEEEIEAANELAREATGDDEAYYDQEFTSPGDIKFVDVDGDDQITENDRDFIGSPHPDFTYGLSIDLKYKIFDMKIFGQGVYGNQIFFGPIYYIEAPSGYWNMSTSMLNHWEEPGDSPETPRLDFDNSNNNLRFSDRYIEEGSFFRLKNVQLGVTLPSNLSESLKVERLRFYIAAQNLLTISKYPGFDPEIGRGIDREGSPGELDMGIDRGLYPVGRSFMMGVNLSF
jgi:TonB-linked SusC/RagA family outer membrane protein